MSDLKEVLDESAALLNAIEQFLVELCSEFIPEWKFYGKQAGWTVAYRCEDRTVFHLIPQPGLFTVVFVLGMRGAAACRDSALPDEVKSSIEKAREYAEGRTVRVEVRTQADVATVKQLVSIKLAN